jgi:putative CocE/NonD family hydrolase
VSEHLDHVVEEFPHKVSVIENAFIPLPDGGRLAARIWLPEDASERPVPAIIEYIPYRKRDITRDRDTINMPYLAGHGYACIRVDLRGSGDSDGILRDQYLEQEQSDGVEAIRWAAQQNWCNGNVGMMGISWGGFNALQIAARQPPELKAIMAACATDDLYADNMHYMGGCLLADNLSESTTMFAFNSCPPDPDIVGPRWRDMWLQRIEESGVWLDIWLRHQVRNEFWKAGSVCEDYSRIKCPVFAVSGWADGYTNAVFRLLEHLEVPRIGLVGPWGHKYPHLGIPGPAIGFLQEVRRWFDYWLKGEETGIMDEPLLRCWMQDSMPPTPSYAERPGRWVAEPSWPAANVHWECWQPHRYGLKAPDERIPKEAEAVRPARLQSPLTVGYFAGKWCSYAAAPDLPDDQRQEDGGALVFESEPLAEPIELLGAPEFEIHFTVDQPIAQVAARLSDVGPDGSANRVTFGLKNLAHLRSNETPEHLVPGEWYTATVCLNNIAQRFPAGHRIRLALSTSYWPLAWPAPKLVRLELDVDRSKLRLPVREPQQADDLLSAFCPPTGAPPLKTRMIEPEHHNWCVHRDLATRTSELEVINDDGVELIEETGTEIEKATYEWYRSQGNDYNSVVGETRTVRGFRRGDWHARVTTRTVLTSDENNFYLQAEIDAFENDKRVFSKNWDEVIERHYL